jgi:ABC-type polysaccharide/polyol phosphate transport system ATPase subunit
MSAAPLISARNLTKAYNLYASPADRLKEALWPRKKRHTVFHALNDVSFDVYPGEHIGIVGVNGAGKSTLLQILTGVLAPSSGTVEVNGRVAALLELGAGFNPELTGRENVVFQLQLSGTANRDLPAKVEEAEHFADIGDFFDQPAKLYSSGMFARVAFACSIFAEPDILIVDEILAVGDARFQKKCHDHMRKMKERGVTILLVSHDIYGVKAASSRMFLLEHGCLTGQGCPEEIAVQYMRILFPSAEPQNGDRVSPEASVDAPVSSPPAEKIEGIILQGADLAHSTRVWGAGGARLVRVVYYGQTQEMSFSPGEECCLECHFDIDCKLAAAVAEQNNVPKFLHIGIRVDLPDGRPLCALPGVNNSEAIQLDMISAHQKIVGKIFFRMPSLAKGEYFFSPGISVGTFDKESYVPLICYDNLLILRCNNINLVHGIFALPANIEINHL